MKTKLAVSLDRSMSAEQATREILRRLFEGIRLNEPGTRDDPDPEFLHDFRVAIRRTRSALGQLGCALPAERVRHFTSEFRWLGRQTGPTRDLDVYLLKLPGYRSLLPAELAAALDPLEELLTRRQREARAALVEKLDSERYASLLVDWSRFLGGPIDEAERTEAANRPAAELAADRIRHLHEKVLALGRRGVDKPKAKRLHRLRIACKKLRYLQEFFIDLHDEAEVKRVVKALKVLQDNLGDFNDLELQQRALRHYARELESDGRPDAAGEPTSAALNELVKRLAREQKFQRQRFAELFSEFANRKNRSRMRRLYGGETGDP